MKWNIDEFIKVTSGILIHKKEELFNRISFDTRDLESVKGSIFFALKNKRDGHDFLYDAYQKQAHVLVVSNIEKWDESIKNKITVIQVSNPLQSLSKWAKYWRNKLYFTAIGVTGSNGKTSTKHFCKILLEEDSSIKFSPQSYNNNLGVCLGVLQMNSSDKVLIQEIGVSHKGDMKELCSIVKPQVAVCTVIGASHTEGLGDIDQVSQEKEWMYRSPSSTFGIFNLDNPYTLSMQERFDKPYMAFSSQNSKAHVFLQLVLKGVNFLDVKGHIQGIQGQCRIPLAGEHHLVSVMASLCIALFLKKSPKDLWKKLSLLKSPEGRCQFLTLNNKVKIFYDAYNSNPQSVNAFIDHLKTFDNQQKSIICLGDMLELGKLSETYHKELGYKVSSLNFKEIFFVGKYRYFFEEGLKKEFFKGKSFLFENYNKDFVSNVISSIDLQGIVAIKASRGIALDRLLKDLDL